MAKFLKTTFDKFESKTVVTHINSLLLKIINEYQFTLKHIKKPDIDFLLFDCTFLSLQSRPNSYSKMIINLNNQENLELKYHIVKTDFVTDKQDNNWKIAYGYYDIDQEKLYKISTANTIELKIIMENYEIANQSFGKKFKEYCSQFYNEFYGIQKTSNKITNQVINIDKSIPKVSQSYSSNISNNNGNENSLNKDTEKFEKQNYLKDLIFNIQNIINKISKITDDITKYKIINSINSQITPLIDSANLDLVEISDKEKASQLKELIEKIIIDTNRFKIQYESSAFIQVENLENEFKNLNNELKELNNPFNIGVQLSRMKIKRNYGTNYVLLGLGGLIGFFISPAYPVIGLSCVFVFILGLILINKKHKKNKIKIQQAENDLKVELDNKMKDVQNKINSNQYLLELDNLKNKYKEYFDIKDFIRNQFSKLNEKWKVNIDIKI